MRLSLFLFIFSFSLPVFSKELPTDICLEEGCTEPGCERYVCGRNGFRIFNEIEEKGSNLKSLKAPQVLSGECFFRGDEDPNATKKHFVGMLYDKENEYFFVKGAFSNWTSENKYKDYDLAKAQEQWGSQKTFPFIEYDTHFYVDKNPGRKSPAWYWYSLVSESPLKVNLIAFWGYSRLALCELGKN